MEERLYEGATFKKLRESRNISLKEAAGDAITPQALSRFEKGQSTIKLDTFTKLLGNLSLNFIEYDILSDEEALPTSDLLAQILKHGTLGNLSKAVELTRDFPTFQEVLPNYTPYRLQLLRAASLMTIYGVNKNTRDFWTKEDEQNILYVWNTMKDLEKWSTQELNFYGYFLIHTSFSEPYLHKEFVSYKAKQLYSELSSYRGNFEDQHTYLSLVLIFTARYFISTGDLVEAELVLNKIRPHINQHLILVAQFYQEEVLLYLAQNNPKGLEIAKKLLRIIDAYTDITNSAFFVNMRANLILKINEKNKTGKPFDL